LIGIHTNMSRVRAITVPTVNQPGIQASVETNSFEHLANPRIRVANPQPAIAGHREVVGANQVTYARCIYLRNARQVEHDVSLPSTEKRPYHVRQLSVVREVQPVFGLNDVNVLRCCLRLAKRPTHHA
jgi:hypothetical protein